MTHSNFLMAPVFTELREGQEATVLQLPAQPATAAEAEAQQRVAYVG
jgi:hypothetical protein